VRCKSGLVYANGTTIFNTTSGYNLPAHAPNATDDYGRTCARMLLLSCLRQWKSFPTCWKALR
jgi:hypothetical protein